MKGLSDTECDERIGNFLLSSWMLCLTPCLDRKLTAGRCPGMCGITDMSHLSQICFQGTNSVGHLCHMDFVGYSLVQEATEDLLEALTKVFGYQSIDNGVDTGVGI